MNVLGDDWGKQPAANILGDLARNPGAGGVGAMGAGMGMGFAAGGVFNGMAQQMFAPMNGGVQQQQQQQSPVQAAPSGRFSQQSDVGGGAGASDDPMESLGKLKKLLDAGLIEQSEYDAKKTEILSRL